MGLKTTPAGADDMLARARTTARLALGAAIVALAVAVTALVLPRALSLELVDGAARTTLAPGRIELVSGQSHITLKASPVPEIILEVDGVPYVVTQVSRMSDGTTNGPHGLVVVRDGVRERVLLPAP